MKLPSKNYLIKLMKKRSKVDLSDCKFEYIQYKDGACVNAYRGRGVLTAYIICANGEIQFTDIDKLNV